MPSTRSRRTTLLYLLCLRVRALPAHRRRPSSEPTTAHYRHARSTSVSRRALCVPPAANWAVWPSPATRRALVYSFDSFLAALFRIHRLLLLRIFVLHVNRPVMHPAPNRGRVVMLTQVVTETRTDGFCGSPVRNAPGTKNNPLITACACSAYRHYPDLPAVPHRLSSPVICRRLAAAAFGLVAIAVAAYATVARRPLEFAAGHRHLADRFASAGRIASFSPADLWTCLR